MAIDRDAVLTIADTLLPDSNVLTDAQMDALLEVIIAQVGDEEENQAEVLCKFLEAVANINIGKAAVDDVPVSEERVGQHTLKFNSGYSSDAWNKFKQSLRFTCPIYGYSPPTNMGVFISPGDKFNILNCCGTCGYPYYSCCCDSTTETFDSLGCGCTGTCTCTN